MFAAVAAGVLAVFLTEGRRPDACAPLRTPLPMHCTDSLPRQVAPRDHGLRVAVHRHALTVLPVLLLGLGACRADSILAPGTPECAGSACDTTPVGQPSAPAVRAPIGDASGRILAGVTDAAANRRLGVALQALEADLAADRQGSARLRTAEVYDLLDELERTADGALHPDAPELTAIRLSIVPAARALGVYQP